MADLASAIRVWENTTSTSSPYELAGVSTAQKGLRTFVDAGVAGDEVMICEAHQSQNEWQWSRAVITDAATDTYVISQVIKSSNADAQVSWTAGTRDVFLFDAHGYSSGPQHTITGATVLSAVYRDVLCNFSSPLAVTLPSVADFQGKDYVIKSINSSVVTITEDSGDSGTIENDAGTLVTSITLTGTGSYVALRSDGTAWRFMGGDDFQMASLAGTETLTNKTINTASNTITVVEADVSDLQSYLLNVVEDTTPQLGGDLDAQGNDITSLGVMSFGDNAGDPTMGSNVAGIYAKDMSGTVEMFAIDEADNATQLSPHDPETGEWVFNSINKTTGRKLKIRMEAFMKKLAEKFPEDFADLIDEEND